MSLTVIIGAKNEGDHLRETLKSLRETQDEDVEVIIVNDGSTDGYNYDALAEEFDSRIIHNEVSAGVGAARHQAVLETKTDNIIIIDGHMRFRRDNWVSKINKHITENPRSVMCCGCGWLDQKRLSNEMNSQAKIDNGLHLWGWRGADINLGNGPRAKWLPKSYYNGKPDTGTRQIPTVMGASYCMSVKWYHHIGGLKFLSAWGQDEQLMSWKSWRLGGDCRIIMDVWIGHIWKTRGAGVSFATPELLKNQYVTAMLGLPEPFRSDVLSYVRSKDGNLKGWRHVEKVYKDLIKEQERIDEADPHNHNFTKLLECNLDITGTAPSHPRFRIARANKHNPKISVLMPVTDKGNIQKAINSFDMQSYENRELIIVNGNPDSKIKLDRSMPNIKVINLEHKLEEKGSLLNIGLEFTTGEYITFLEPNDYMLPQYLYHSITYSNKRAFVMHGYVGQYSGSDTALFKMVTIYRSSFIKKSLIRTRGYFLPSEDPYKDLYDRLPSEDVQLYDLSYNGFCVGKTVPATEQHPVIVNHLNTRSAILKDMEDLRWA